jgi:hypothetical protein
VKASSSLSPCRLIALTATWVDVQRCQLSNTELKLASDLQDTAIFDQIAFPYVTVSSGHCWILRDIAKLTS